ncbi:MAG TPA: DNA helicase RecQ [Marinilabiliales bacterium]|nr:MAG: ATP-dependent DNA helicase RecQ [Bacteroidetes bacterium GWA2_40_14]OFX59909.1 MAG: ATP-dependent DNA helicase RecQ [Bacteroidetes bacterium GWC2_40_13]OFX75132.1 MAG: ATP-dependent DNA helicase RecQ [Bacteroidetes bacterium GWD2_40_43]OFX93819.1 MAG: ATP-dependent DNA helicase RecQ [Bacteroidetes bacterium GWE2_40_63]OFY18108.1 MAG: ATP-dependent DNA helicase RecQ [Bacteroidetes bacterium GWF2_40_13]HAM99019.1 DNA helicase RecQ [Marinilabiliales bacterium]
MELTGYLKKHFGFDTFKGNQEEIIKNVLAGRDTFVLMPTGGGKSLCYQLPALIKEGTAIIISPLIALMKNQVDAMRGFSDEDGVAHFLNSSLTKNEIQVVKSDILAGKTKMLYVAPESLTKEENIKFLQQIQVSFYAIDEAHCISEWGHDFRPEYRRIRPIVEEIGKAPIIALTATATPKVQHDIQKNLGMLHADIFKSSFNRPNLYYEVRPKTDATKEIIKILKNNPGKSGIIYCLSRKKVEELAETLQVNGIKALAYHAGMDSNTRSQNQDKFLMEEVEIIVATIAFGMGIDKPDVRLVIHYDIPKSLEGYYQETGRAGRDGGEGRCITFYSYKDIQKLEKFMQGKPVAEQEIGRHLLLETVSYAESALCRRKHLLHYFGEEYTQHNCETCDNCQNPKEQFEGQEYIEMLLQVVVAVKEYFKADHVASILCGTSNYGVKSYKHHHLPEFGIGKEKDLKFWNAVIRQALIAKFLAKDIENYGLLKMTAKGHAFLEHPEPFMMMHDHDYDKAEEELSAPQGGGSADPMLFAMLKDLRKKIAKEKNLPPFVIFQDPSLEDMAIHYPITAEEMQNMTGVGAGKASRYGKEFCELIAIYVNENEIDRPVDLVVKSVVNKSGLKVHIIQSIDRKVALDDIAQSKGIEMNDLLKEIEAIVFSGTKLNIDYYINEVLDEEHQDEIYDYFREEAQSESIDDALKVLGEDEYTEEDIRLMRIKFLCNEGN